MIPASSISGRRNDLLFAGNVALNGIYNVTGNTLLRYGTLSGNSLTTGGLFIFASGFLNVANTVANAGISLTPDPQTGGPTVEPSRRHSYKPGGPTCRRGAQPQPLAPPAVAFSPSSTVAFSTTPARFTAVQGQIATVGNGNLFNNTGTFISACTAGTYTIDAPFSNSGIVNVQSGTFTLDGSVQQLQGSAACWWSVECSWRNLHAYFADKHHYQSSQRYAKWVGIDLCGNCPSCQQPRIIRLAKWPLAVTSTPSAAWPIPGSLIVGRRFHAYCLRSADGQWRHHLRPWRDQRQCRSFRYRFHRAHSRAAASLRAAGPFSISPSIAS